MCTFKILLRLRNQVHINLVRQCRVLITVSKMSQSGLPHYAEGVVIKGFGRGSKELGIATANFSDEVVNKLPSELKTGVYYGYAQVEGNSVHKMVMSVGWNPYYKNSKKSMETHIMHDFSSDFYGKKLKVCMLGFIRPESDFKSLDELIVTIKNDIRIADQELDKPENESFKLDKYFL